MQNQICVATYAKNCYAFFKPYFHPWLWETTTFWWGACRHSFDMKAYVCPFFAHVWTKFQILWLIRLNTWLYNISNLAGRNNQIAIMLDLTLLTLETYNLCFIASKLLTVADMLAIWFPLTGLTTRPLWIFSHLLHHHVFYYIYAYRLCNFICSKEQRSILVVLRQIL